MQSTTSRCNCKKQQSHVCQDEAKINPRFFLNTIRCRRHISCAAIFSRVIGSGVLEKRDIRVPEVDEDRMASEFIKQARTNRQEEPKTSEYLNMEIRSSALIDTPSKAKAWLGQARWRGYAN